MTETVPISPWDGGTLFDQHGNRVGSYNKETGRGMFAHAFFVDERTCHIRHNVPSIEGADGWGTCDLVSKCSACGAIAFRDPYSGGYGNYCRNCGARVVKR